jgi:hypothetical protein
LAAGISTIGLPAQSLTAHASTGFKRRFPSQPAGAGPPRPAPSRPICDNLSRILQEWMRDALIKRLASYYCLENKAALQREAEN